MANTFKNAVSSAVGTSTTSVYTVPADTTSTVIGLVVSNIHSAEISIDIQVTDTSAGTTVYMLKAAPIPIGGAIVPI